MLERRGDDDTGWTSLSRRAGSPFHSAEFCDVVQRFWPGADPARHVVLADGGHCRGILPGYLYGACPRLNYYRGNVSPALTEPIIGAHALVAWYGGPVAEHDRAMAEAIEVHLELCRRDAALSFLFGIDGRDRATREILLRLGYRVSRYHTNAVLTLSPDHARDPLAALPKKERDERRRVMRRAEEAGLELIIVPPAQALPYVELVRSAVVRQGIDDEVFPSAFVRGVLQAGLPGLEVMLAQTPRGQVAAIGLNFVWRDAYYLWLAGNDRQLAKPYFPSDFLYQHAIRRAASLGLAEVQGGRSPYDIKLAYGFRCIPLLAAVHPASVGDPRLIDAWLAAQLARHLATYPEVAA
jgi:hypothetical protein